MVEPSSAPLTFAGQSMHPVPFPLVVDFGTSSTIACTAKSAQDMAPRYFPDDGPEPTMLLFESVADPMAPQYTVGQNARARAFAHPLAAVPSIKKLLGRPEPCHVVAIDGTETDFAPDDLARLFLTKFLEDALTHLGWWPERIVCTYPRSFSPPQVEQLRALVREVLDGFAARDGIGHVPTVETAFDEANASALYCLTSMLDELTDRRQEPASALTLLDERTILAFDVGGGTTDYVRICVSLQDAANAQRDRTDHRLPSIHTQVEALGGDFAFGGDMITAAVIHVLERKLCEHVEGAVAVPCAPGPSESWRDNFFTLFRIGESIKVRMSTGAARVLIRDVLSELPGPVRIALGGEEPREESFDAARLSTILADVAVHREEVDALVRPAIERNIEGLVRLGAGRRADVLVLAGNGVQYPLFHEIIQARRNDLLTAKGRILASKVGGKLYVATGAYRALINNMDGFRLLDLHAAAATAVSTGDYFFLTTTGRVAKIPGLRQPFIQVGDVLDAHRGLVYDTGDERPPLRIPIGAFVVGRRLQGQPETERPVPVQLFYPSGPIPERVNGRPARDPASADRTRRWAQVKDTIRMAWSDFNEAIGTLAHAQAATDGVRVQALVATWSDPPDLGHASEQTLLNECHAWLRRMLEAYTTIQRLKELRRLRYRKVKLRQGLAERLRKCVDLVDDLAATADAPVPEEPTTTPENRDAVFYQVRLRTDFTIGASYRGDGFELDALTTGTPSQFFETASVFDLGTSPFARG